MLEGIDACDYVYECIKVTEYCYGYVKSFEVEKLHEVFLVNLTTPLNKQTSFSIQTVDHEACATILSSISS